MKIIYTWEQYVEDIEKLYRTYKDYGTIIKNIYCVPFSGYMVGVPLSKKLGIPIITDSTKIRKHTLVVDDVVETGKTLTKLLKDKSYFGIATLWMYGNYKRDFLVTYCRITTDKIYTPWEINKK